MDDQIQCGRKTGPPQGIVVGSLGEPQLFGCTGASLTESSDTVAVGTKMNAAFCFIERCPAAIAIVFARLYPAGAGLAADGRESVFRQRMNGQTVLGDIALQIAKRPIRQRLETVAAIGEFERLHAARSSV